MAFRISSPFLKKEPCKIPYPGKEVYEGKHGGVMTKEMAKANAKKRNECNKKDPRWVANEKKQKENDQNYDSDKKPKK